MFDRNQWLRWCVCGVVSLGLMLAYVVGGLRVTDGVLLMPLDDTYIHFQYAHQLAAGQPYVYNPGLPPTSGATSFLYPYVLAVGDLAGFRGLALGAWAIFIGWVALTISMMLVHRLTRSGGAPEGIAWGVTLAFAGGASAWHAFSGMETLLVILLLLGTFDALRSAWAIGTPATLTALTVWACALALIRPEGGWFAVAAVGSAAWANRRMVRLQPRFGALLLLPIVALGVQPLVNLLLTGSAVASGNAAKSIFGAVPFDLGTVLARWVQQTVRIGWEALSGVDSRGVWYMLPLLPLLAAFGVWNAPRGQRTRLAVLLLMWLGGGAVLVATLDTAFWHFKRYQMPLLALLFPLAGWGLAGWWQRGRVVRWLTGVLVGVWVLAAAGMAAQFAYAYQLNVGYVNAQPYAMARWLAANTAPEVTVAVHDTGMMRYQGRRNTLDMVGLTTPGAAEYWRSGPGAMAEFVMRRRPDWIASYGPGHGFGLGMLADTSLFGAPVASFEVTLDNRYNVALAATFQGVYRPDWTAADRRSAIWQPSSQQYSAGMLLMDSLNVGDVADEQAHAYAWTGTGEGFPTEVHEADYAACSADTCRVVDGGRRLVREQFRVRLTAGEDALLLTRVLPAAGGGRVAVSVNGESLAERWIPDVPGQWVEIPLWIPAERVQAETLISVTTVAGVYAAYAHFAYQGHFDPAAFPNAPDAVYQDGAFALVADEPVLTGKQLEVRLHWTSDGTSRGDYVAFVHVSAALDRPPDAQADGRSGGGALPPGDWLPATISDTFMVDLSKLSPGQYTVSVGLYDPVSGERLLPEPGGAVAGVVIIGKIEIR